MSQPNAYPPTWTGATFNPSDRMLQLKGKDYLTVQTRLQWFVSEQRALIVAGLATMPYVVRTDLVELDPERGFAHFLTYVRDVLGNEATMFGSETAKDFGDFIEKASTKSLGRALAMLGYSTGAATDMDEGDRPVDAPQERRTQMQPRPQGQPPARQIHDGRAPAAPGAGGAGAAPRDEVPAGDQSDGDGAGGPTLADFLRACRQELNLTPPDILAKLGVKSLAGINYDRALATLRADLRQLPTGTARP